jgi:hypothetical protein
MKMTPANVYTCIYRVVNFTGKLGKLGETKNNEGKVRERSGNMFGWGKLSLQQGP